MKVLLRRNQEPPINLPLTDVTLKTYTKDKVVTGPVHGRASQACHRGQTKKAQSGSVGDGVGCLRSSTSAAVHSRKRL
ncbi:hypothetical protein DEV91_13624 [Phyllobacterium brassicacearum]|nr:hypothetical protein DEV91_13624 [Phyllobacterium brassicacearum]